MTPLTFLLLAAAGGLGAGGRFLADEAIRARLGGPFPAGTLAVNVVGSFLLGVVAGSPLGPETVAVLGAGFLGGFTTFSTASLDAVRLGLTGRPWLGVGYATLTAVLAVSAAALGFAGALALAGP